MLMFVVNDADWCNGSTADSDSVSRGSSPLSVVTIGVWLSLVERYVRDVEVACSNHVTPITKNPCIYKGFCMSTEGVLFIFISLPKNFFHNQS